MTEKQYLVSKGDGLWELEGDPNTFISRDDTFQTECDDPHPMRFSKQEIRDWHALSPFERDRRFSHEYNWAMRNDKRGYMCPGGELHYYSMWTVMINGDWTEDMGETFAQARAVLEDAIGKVTLKRQRKEPEPEVNPAHMHQYAVAALNTLAMTTEVRALLEDELQALNENIDRIVTLMATEDGPYVDRELLAQNRRRKREIEQLLGKD